LLFPLEGDNTALVAGFTGQRTEYALATAAALISNADQLAMLWQEHRADYISGAWFDDDPRRSVSMTLNEILGSVEVMAKDHLGKPLGVRLDGTSQPDEVYAIRSGADITLIGAKLVGVEAYFDMEYGFGAYLTSIGSEALAQEIIAEFAAARLAWSALEGKTLSEWVMTDRAPVEALYEHLRILVRLIKVDTANVTGITITFNDADGD
jgi:predicted lipoprotein